MLFIACICVCVCLYIYINKKIKYIEWIVKRERVSRASRS